MTSAMKLCGRAFLHQICSLRAAAPIRSLHVFNPDYPGPRHINGGSRRPRASGVIARFWHASAHERISRLHRISPSAYIPHLGQSDTLATRMRA